MPLSKIPQEGESVMITTSSRRAVMILITLVVGAPVARGGFIVGSDPLNQPEGKLPVGPITLIGDFTESMPDAVDSTSMAPYKYNGPTEGWFSGGTTSTLWVHLASAFRGGTSMP